MHISLYEMNCQILTMVQKLASNVNAVAVPSVFAVLSLSSNCVVQAQGVVENVLVLEKAEVHFVSDAPLELIEATSTDLKAVIDTITGKFAFAVQMTSFLGFNSDLQRTHFNENYLESEIYPRSMFIGKIIEAWETPTDSPREVRAKGKLTIHGIAVERLIFATIRQDGTLVRVHSEFTVPVADHNIKIPRLVGQKIASEINVEIDAWFSSP